MADETWSSTTRAVNQEFTHTWTINKFADNMNLEDGKLESAPFYIPGLPGSFSMKLEKTQEPGKHSANPYTPTELKIGNPPVKTVITSYFSVAIASHSGTPAGTRLAGRLEVREEDEEVVTGEFGDGNDCIFDLWRVSFETCSDGKWMFELKQKATYEDYHHGVYSATGFYTLGLAPQLTLVATLTVPGKLSTTSGEAAVMDNTDKMFDFRPLLKEPKHLDIVLTCKGKTFRCHKVILSARSEVFDRMLDSNMSEAKSGEVVVEDMEPEVLQKVVEYIYTGEVVEKGEVVAELLYAADKYHLTGLVRQCAREFHSDITPDNAAAILLLAERHGLHELKQTVMMKIVCEKKKFLGDPMFNKEIKEYPDILMELLKL